MDFCLPLNPLWIRLPAVDRAATLPANLRTQASTQQDPRQALAACFPTKAKTLVTEATAVSAAMRSLRFLGAAKAAGLMKSPESLHRRLELQPLLWSLHEQETRPSQFLLSPNI